MDAVNSHMRIKTY